ncbi:E3 ubiquitin-protein ligase WAV3-like [Dendrobium catenatum]|uniref:Uncharacterized protein n=1 Tax=Dendrobium catenatum TaxID=906689 RepID=A0A2I0VBX7_9ASPA|nr:E3 ubiquitin-protein ligase WAV3-like [Dendrobium catenatum]PKU60897.1 hypothetical protein MA16_Dca015441 [Dendrobium catenatum]
MGTGWRRAFCTSIPRDPENAVATEKRQDHRRVRQQLSASSSPSNPSHSPGSCAKFGVFSGGGSSNSSSLRLRCRTGEASSEHPLLSPALDSMSGHHCKNGDFTTPCTPPPPSSAGVKGSPRLLLTRSNPASPRSPSRFALLKATLRLSRSRCGICSQSVRTGQRTAVFTAECSHSFHFPCISTHVRNQSRNQAGCLSCPVCSASWREVPLLSSAHSQAAPLPPSSTNKDFNNFSHTSKARIQRGGENDLKQSGNNKLYDDDEPLLLSSTTQGGGGHHFNPIPEADLEDEAEGGISCGRNGVEVGGCGVEVVVLPEAALVSADRNHQSYVILLRVKAPAFAQRSVSKVAASVLDPSCRAPIDLVTVLDVSGSMTSTAKLQMLKRAMRLLISSLGSSDRLSIVAFSAGAKRLLPLVRMSRQGQRSARQIVDRLIVCGSGGGRGDNGVQGDCRCIGHALRKATKVLEDRRERNPVATIMLLSDSHQEQKRGKEGSSDSSPRLREEETDMEKHLRNPIPSSTDNVATRFAHLEIPIGCSTELGSGGVNHVEDVFSKCVSGLVSLVLQDVHLQLTFPSAFVSSIYSHGTPGGGGGGGGEGCVGLAISQGQGGNGAISVRLGDFYADEKRELLVELRLPAAAPQQQRNDFLFYKCCYRDPTSRELVLCQERSLVLPSLRQISPMAVNSRELRNLFITTRALVESRRLADHNDLETAAHLLSTARTLLLQSNSVPSHHQKYVTSLELRLSEIQRRHRRQQLPSSSSMARPSDQLTPTSAWRAAEQLAKVAILRKSMSRVGDLHGFENARF